MGIDYDTDNRYVDYDHREWYTDWHLRLCENELSHAPCLPVTGDLQPSREPVAEGLAQHGAAGRHRIRLICLADKLY